MQLEGVSAVIGASTTLLISVVGGVLFHKRQMKKQSNQSMVGNFQALFNEVRTDVSNLREEQREERKQWANERLALYKTVDELREQNHTKEIEVVRLRGEVRLLTTQLDAYRSSQTASAGMQGGRV